eukprot:8325237-Alexandrium_andersonii.AAC.1
MRGRALRHGRCNSRGTSSPAASRRSTAHFTRANPHTPHGLHVRQELGFKGRKWPEAQAHSAPVLVPSRVGGQQVADFGQ